ncbi:C6 zinc finger domain-containing protein [Dactylonectria estremocensis]|uniref:C6 zinc finger domain-containing protein n=1 Tax=Dactylonectria estremocensis TaxID=1079267 RepID=A0A9P9IIJ6_9HYPO|nr:C6 zinc finger domain-containing protein [Dactylonectria estremocensis]
MDTSAPNAAPASPSSRTDAKRRRIRKGTRSCWECKRRKIRCSYAAPGDDVCVGCDRRGSRCLSQAVPETPAATGRRGRQMGDRIVRVEALIEQLVRQVGDRSTVGEGAFDPSENTASEHAPSDYDAPNTAVSISTSTNAAESTRLLTAAEYATPDPTLEVSGAQEPDWSPVLPTPKSLTPLTPLTTTPSKQSRYGSISAALYAALPPRQDIHLMIKAGLDISFDKLMMQPHAVLAQSPGGGRANLDDVPPETAHPVLLAKYLLVLATCLQYANPELHAAEVRRLSEPPDRLMRRLARVAYGLVVNNDEFLGSVEFLECVMLEAFYQANSGNLRRAWFACRRGMVVAQMMGLHRNGSRQPIKIVGSPKPLYPSYIWFRIVWADRQLCLMLGLPQGSLDESIASEAALAGDTPSDRFERKQSVIASRILERNESSDPGVMDDFAALQKLDAELQKTANEMGSKWWLPPTLANLVHDPEVAFWETLRLLEQMIYFNLLNMLHLPYMLRSNAPDISYNFEYSKLASVSASRELLTRFIMFRSFNRVAFCCRSTDFHGLIAAMTLVIAHLDGHRREGNNVLAHQRNSDRAMMDQVLENMDSVAEQSTDALSERSSSLLRSLLALEADAAEGRLGNAAAVMTEMHPDLATDDGQSLRINIPYFGTIRISREGIISMEAPRSATPPSPGPQRELPGDITTTSATCVSMCDDTVDRPNGSFSTHTLPLEPSPFGDAESGKAFASQQPQKTTPTSPAEAQLPTSQPHQAFAPQFQSAITDALHQQYLYPGLTAGVDDWAFQGVDMSFFDSLMRGSGAENAADDMNNWEDP